jgi:hypothetical protein
VLDEVPLATTIICGGIGVEIADVDCGGVEVVVGGGVDNVEVRNDNLQYPVHVGCWVDFTITVTSTLEGAVKTNSEDPEIDVSTRFPPLTCRSKAAFVNVVTM